MSADNCYEDYDKFELTDPQPPYDKWSQFMELSKDLDKVSDNSSKLLNKMKSEMKEMLTPKVVSDLFDKTNDLIKQETPTSEFTISFNAMVTPHNINQECISNDIIARAVAILIILYVRKGGRKIFEDHINRVDKFNNLREAIDDSLAVLSNEFLLEPVYYNLVDLCPKLLRDYPEISAEDVFKSYLFDLSCINGPLEDVQDHQTMGCKFSVDEFLKNHQRTQEMLFGQFLYYSTLRPKKMVLFKEMEPTYATVSFTMRFADVNGIKILPLPKEKSGAWDIDIDTRNNKIYLPRLDMQYFCRKANFLSLVCEHTNFKCHTHIQSLLTIYDSLIENGEDVALLQMSGVLLHDFPSNQDCADFMNSTTRNIKHHLPRELVDDLKKIIQKTKSPGYKSTLYFKSVWGVNWYTWVAFVILLIGWFISTIASIISTIYTLR
ncbi:hypothetical protein Glove_14g28 [Diversispora epigaea]|uniref:Uncharacterized protein n=1 Tax=Diversispora epigaea TaxID=1348612 RepID=A0A397JM81_9GLOM|nr:hypothetical protein Glove_14g28 [Diversispora epigaea]